MSLEPTILYLNTHKEKEVAVTLLETFGKHAWQFQEYDDLSKCFFKLKLYTKAAQYGELALATAYTNERKWVARSNLINIYNHANQPEKALYLIKANELVIPEDQDTRLEKAFSWFLMGERDKAEAILQAELERSDLKDETRTKILFNLGTYCLYRDEFQKGLELFLVEGKKLDFWKKPRLPFTFWEGGVQPNKEIVLYAEAGIGDELINVRFMKHFQDLGMHPIWFTDRKDLAEIFNYNGLKTITSKSALPSDCLWTHSMNVPVYLGLQYSDLFKHGPYLKPLPKYEEKFKWMKESTLPRLGIRWQGNPEYDHDLHRSVPLADIFEATKLPQLTLSGGVALFSIQRDNGLEELEPYRSVCHDLSEDMQSFGETMSILNNLDIVVTTCTSVAHASAAMGKRTFIFVPITAYYLWSHSMKQSPWYGENVTLLRQSKPRSWVEPIQELKEILSRELHDAYRSLNKQQATTS